MQEQAASSRQEQAVTSQTLEDIREEIRRMRIEHWNQMVEMKNLLIRQQIEHEGQLKTIREEIEELRRHQTEHQKQLKTSEEDIELRLGSQRIEFEEQKRTAIEELDMKLEQKISHYKDLWEELEMQKAT
jgi:hypothetical protein